jgi:putative ABC transport system permease protein
VNWEFFETYKLEMAAGRAFNREFPTDKNFKVIINETAARKLGYQDPTEAIGDKWTSEWIQEQVDSLSEGQIIGVVRDFHFQSLKNKLEPLTLVLDEDWMSKISIRYEQGQDREAIDWVEKTWRDHFPDVHFEYSFVDDYLTRFYKADQKLQTILLIFTVLAIIIACLGLFGLAIFVARQRTKEIGVRKALGSSAFGIVFLLSKAFSKWVLLANLIAWPLAWYFMNEWLSSFAYRTSLSPWIFISAGILALAIALLTIAHRAYITAQRNPVDALRYE